MSPPQSSPDSAAAVVGVTLPERMIYLKKRTMHRAICLVAAAAMSCSPLLNLTGMGISAAAAEETDAANELVPVIVTVAGDAVLATDAGAAQGADFLDTDEAAQIGAALEAEQRSVQDAIRLFYPALEIKYSYNVLINGFACEIPEHLIPLVERIPSVKSVSRVETRDEPMMSAAAALGGFPAYYDATGCTGEGQVVAIIDSELDITNPMFSAIDDKDVALKKEDIERIAGEGGFNIDIDPDKAYISSKLPYVIDYVDDPYDGVANISSYHGTHVSGIAAGNEVTDYYGNKIAGVAKDAQIVFMAVGAGGYGISEDAVIAATEDAIKLNADVINMSFGGEGESIGDDPMDALFEHARNAGIVICKSAGNSGCTQNTPDNPDTGTLDGFKAGSGFMSIASADNTYTEHYHAFKIGDELIPYTEYYLPETGLQRYYLGDLLTEKEYELVNLGDGFDLYMMAMMSSEDYGYEEPTQTEEPQDDSVLAETTTPAAVTTTTVETTAAESEATTVTTKATSPVVTDPAYTDTGITVIAPEETGVEGTETTAEEEDPLMTTIALDDMPMMNFDLEGKVIYIELGGFIDIEATLQAAASMGAVGAVLGYPEGEIAVGIEYDLGIPYGLVNYEDGQKINASDATTIEFTDETVDLELPTQVSNYSSWGVHQSLELRPDIMGIGGNVESAAYNGGQSIMSGTSMSSPYVTGCTAILTQYLKKNGLTLTGAEKFDFVRNLMMNSAVPYMNGDLFASPRQQGAGFVSLNNAICDKVIMTGSEGAAKINLYDKLGTSFNFPVTLTNISDEDVKFKSARIELTTDSTDGDESGVFISGQQALSSSADASALCTIAAGEQRTETVSVQLDAAQLAKISETFCNGFFVEGYLLLEGADNCCDISIPLLGYYGDWAGIPIFRDETELTYDLGSYSMMAGTSVMEIMEVMEQILNRASQEERDTLSMDEIFQMYATDEDYEFFFNMDDTTNADLVLSPNGDGLADNVNVMAFIQRCGNFSGLDIYDAKGNLVAEGNSIPIPFKDMSYPFAPAQSLASYNLKDGEYTAVCKGSIFYPGADENPQKLEMKFRVDNAAPKLSTSVREENGRRILTISCSDADLDGIFVSGTGKGGVVGEFDPKAEPVNAMTAFEVASSVSYMMAIMGGNSIANIQTDTIPLFGKLLGNYAQYADFVDVDFTDLIPVSDDSNGKFSVEYDITDLKNYSFTAIDRALNMTSYESELASVAQITPGIWKNQNRVFAFTDKDGGYAMFKDGSRSEFTYTLENGEAELTFENEKLHASLVQVNSMTMRLTWEDGKIETLYYFGEGTLDDYTFFTLDEIEAKVLAHFEANYAPMILPYEMTRHTVTLDPKGTVTIEIYIDYEGMEMLLGIYEIDICTGVGYDIAYAPFSMVTIPLGEVLHSGTWLATSLNDTDAGYYWFDGEGNGTFVALADGSFREFTYEFTEQTILFTFKDDADAQPAEAQVIALDEDRICLYWGGDDGDVLTFKTDETLATFEFYTAPELCEMAKKDYEQKNGTAPADAEIVIDTDFNVTVQLKDESGKVIDTYTVDPADGTGTNAEGEAVDLPQTGINDAKPMTIALFAFMLTAAGALTIVKSGVLRKKDEQI